ncbi:MAG TPA: hypothetical protein IGS37_13545 [Synechococcales cyanobacterium M55_K2018_004]|nr:hypothetical protein [Synechococcales cyanobacterium M55_K2018_004]
MVSPYLQAERDRLLEQIASIQKSGEIAPANVRIEPDFLNPKCWLLTHTNLPMRERQLGQSCSAKYHDWMERIHRRDRLQELEYELSVVEGLLERQSKTEYVFLPDAPTIDVGDEVEFDGNRYKVEDVGLRYLRLIDNRGKVTRCEISAAKLLSKAAV